MWPFCLLRNSFPWARVVLSCCYHRTNIPAQGCIVSQENKTLLTGLSIVCAGKISALTTIFTTALLTSPNLPSLIALNKKQLAVSYATVTSFLDRHKIEYIPASAGVYVFAKLAPAAKTWDDEADMVRRLEAVGILIGSGRSYHAAEDQKGWARLTFAIETDQLEKALERIEGGLGLERKRVLPHRGDDKGDTADGGKDRANGEVVDGDIEYDGRVILYIVKGWSTFSQSQPALESLRRLSRAQRD